MEIGEIVCWRGRRFRLRGFTPMSQPEMMAEIEDVETGEWLVASLEEIEPDRADRPAGSVLPFRARRTRRRP